MVDIDRINMTEAPIGDPDQHQQDSNDVPNQTNELQQVVTISFNTTELETGNVFNPSIQTNNQSDYFFQPGPSQQVAVSYTTNTNMPNGIADVEAVNDDAI